MNGTCDATRPFLRLIAIEMTTKAFGVTITLPARS